MWATVKESKLEAKEKYLDAVKLCRDLEKDLAATVIGGYDEE